MFYNFQPAVFRKNDFRKIRAAYKRSVAAPHHDVSPKSVGDFVVYQFYACGDFHSFQLLRIHCESAGDFLRAFGYNQGFDVQILTESKQVELCDALRYGICRSLRAHAVKDEKVAAVCSRTLFYDAFAVKHIFAVCRLRGSV